MSAYPPIQYVDIGDDLQMAYREMGHSAAPTVVFVHGSGPGASGRPRGGAWCFGGGCFGGT